MRFLLIVSLCIAAASTFPSSFIIDGPGFRANVEGFSMRELVEISAGGLREDNLDEENDSEDGSSDLASDRPKRTVDYQDELFQAPDIYPRTSVIQQQISRYEGIRDLLNYRKNMLRKKLAFKTKKKETTLGEALMMDDRIGFSYAAS